MEKTGAEVVSKHRAQFAMPPKGEHMWVFMALFKASPEVRGTAYLDHESLISVDGPICYKCEKPYSKAVAEQPCEG